MVSRVAQPGRVSKRRPRIRRFTPLVSRSPVFPRIDDDREIPHGHLGEVLWPMPRRGIEEQGVARLHRVTPIGVAIANLAREHIDELEAGMAELSIRLRAFAERDQVGLDADLAFERVP